MDKTKAKKMDAQQFKTWIEGKGAICQVVKSRLECVIDIDHIESGHYAALYVVLTPTGVQVIELAEYFPTLESAWVALQDENCPTHPAAPVTEWVKEQYLTDKSAKVEKLEI
ncbi:MAG: hypothetical protein ABRQ23_00770 [Syntrophomonadaceae bacterium]